MPNVDLPQFVSGVPLLPAAGVASGLLVLLLVWALLRRRSARKRSSRSMPSGNVTNGNRPAYNAYGVAPERGRDSSGLHPRNLTRDPYVSVVIPCYNEEGNIQPMYERLTAALAPATSKYELIFVNNGSYDSSATILDALVAADSHVSVLTLSRNFQAQGAYTSGLEYASGDCTVCLDGDIQDPPEMIPAFIERWREGYDVVYGVRARRKGSIIRRIGYKAFYRILRKISYIDIPVDASDFGLMDRRVVDVVNAMPERSRLIRGLRAWAGFRQVGIPYTREERFSGKTTNSIRGLFRWASLGIVSFSYAPLDLISYLAGLVVALAAVAIVVYTALYFIVPNAPRGFETLLVAVLFLGAVQLLCLSIIGTYLARMFEEIKARPKYLIQDVQNDHRGPATAHVLTNSAVGRASAGAAADGDRAVLAHVADADHRTEAGVS